MRGVARTIAVGNIEDRPAVKQPRRNVLVAVPAGEDERRVAVLVGEVHVSRVLLEQAVDLGEVAVGVDWVAIAAEAVLWSVSWGRVPCTRGLEGVERGLRPGGAFLIARSVLGPGGQRRRVGEKKQKQKTHGGPGGPKP